MRRNESKEEPEMDESWLLPYADLLTLLLALFIVLFAMSQIDSQKYEALSQVFNDELTGGDGMLDGNPSPMDDTDIEPQDEDNDGEGNSESEKDLEELQAEVEQYIESNDLTDSIGTKLSDEGLLISIFTDVTFDSGSAEINKQGEKIAKKVSNVLDTTPPYEIVISGHADDRPINTFEFESNWELSVIRSVNFMKILLKNSNLDPAMFSSKGFGDLHPIAPNDTEENRAKNRRVEVLILPYGQEDTEKNQHQEN